MDYKAPKLPYGMVKLRTDEWLKRKPKTRSERQRVRDECGDQCFLIPNEFKYPVCSIYNCDYDCDGIRDANANASVILNRIKVSKEAKRRAKVAKRMAKLLGYEYCDWY